jgi:hypothetical protein
MTGLPGSDKASRIAGSSRPCRSASAPSSNEGAATQMAGFMTCSAQLRGTRGIRALREQRNLSARTVPTRLPRRRLPALSAAQPVVFPGASWLYPSLCSVGIQAGEHRSPDNYHCSAPLVRSRCHVTARFCVIFTLRRLGMQSSLLRVFVDTMALRHPGGIV